MVGVAVHFRTKWRETMTLYQNLDANEAEVDPCGVHSRFVAGRAV